MEFGGGLAERIECLGDVAFETVFQDFAATVDTARVTALVVGRWGDVSQTEGHPGRLLAQSADRFPALRALFLGDVDDEIVYVEHADLTPILDAYPALEELWVRGTPDLSQKTPRYFEAMRHPGLRRLVLQSGGLHPEAIRAISRCDLPELRHLELYLGHPDWCGWAKPEDLAWLVAGEAFPKLDHLGLRNSLIQDGIAAALAHAPVVAGLRVLDLSLGALGDDGAQALLHGQPLDHLALLDLHHHYLSDAMQDRLRSAWLGVDVDLSDAQTESRGRRSIAVAE
ncbi:hypothetical protein ABH926_002814 [Catenulispora sp. GP43]|uniref:STM4015 family protein n=1 Tax=Catenulispora sp. GP43 TaxID=3156263 RepID=UPI0035116B0D